MLGKGSIDVADIEVVLSVATDNRQVANAPNGPKKASEQTCIGFFFIEICDKGCMPIGDEYCQTGVVGVWVRDHEIRYRAGQDTHK